MTEERTDEQKVHYWMGLAKEAMSENARMRDLLDCRPALNAGLVEAYENWTRLVYTSDAFASGALQPEVH